MQIITVTAGENILSNRAVYISSADSKAYLATSVKDATGFVIAPIIADSIGQVFQSGLLPAPVESYSGLPVYLSATPGVCTITKPVGDYQKLGILTDGGLFMFNPSPKASTSGGGESGLMSITGPGVDNTDPENPIINARPYKVYVANVTQTGGVDPVAVVLENTTGATLTWTRLGPGQYRISSTGLFSTPSKLSLPGARVFVGGEDDDLLLSTSWIRIDNNNLEMRTTELKLGFLSQSEWHNTDEGFTIEIRIYP